jgi:hypothetical protein
MTVTPRNWPNQDEQGRPAEAHIRLQRRDWNFGVYHCQDFEAAMVPSGSPGLTARNAYTPRSNLDGEQSPQHHCQQSLQPKV